MSVVVRLGVALAAVSVLFAACSINLSDKNACNDAVTDCVPGYACVSHICTPTGGGGTVGGGYDGGNPGTIDGGPDASLPRMCPTSPVTACAAANPGGTCEETFCGGRLWQNGVMKSLFVLYRFWDPAGTFSESDLIAIRAGAAAWTRASSGFLTFQECTNCMGRFISVVPGDTDGITNPDDAEQFLPMPIASRGGWASPHRIAHQWGHVAGLAHTYERADRDRYMAFDQDLWCPPGGSGLPPHCAAGTGTFGVFDGKSKMNGFHRDGICIAEEPDEDSDEPTIGDLSALAELFFGATSLWSPFQPIGQDLSPTQPLDYQLAPGVDPMGSPAIAEVDYASPEIFVRGTDHHVYTTARSDPSASTPGWRNWTSVTDGVDADPAVVFAVGNRALLFLAVRSLDGNIYLSARRDGNWGDWTSLGAPPSGAASAPALASESPFSQAVVVRGGDGLIYYRLACTDVLQNCATSASGPDAWSVLPPPLPPPASNIFVGKPSAVWPLDNAGLTVAAIRDDRVAVVMNHINMTGGTTWLPANNVDLAPDDPNPGVAITLTPTPGEVLFFARNRQGLLVSDTLDTKFFPIGGVLLSPPGAVAMYHTSVRTDVAAIIDDHGHPGVWWRYNDANYAAPCHYNSPGTCGVCGLP